MFGESNVLISLSPGMLHQGLCLLDMISVASNVGLHLNVSRIPTHGNEIIIMKPLGEVLVFYLPICFFYYFAKLIIFIRLSRIPCIFFMKGDSREFI